MNTAIIRRCKCGSKPAIMSSRQHGVNILRLECACGRHGATMMYLKPRDKERTRQAAIDGWNLSD